MSQEDKPRPLHLLVVCSANICRSPMAEALVREAVMSRGHRVEVRSGGVLGIEGRAADPKAVSVMEELGLDISRHQSRGITEEDIRWADFILVMELRHQSTLHERFPSSEGKVLLLGTFGGGHEIGDPIGRWRWHFRRSRDELHRCAERFAAQLPARPYR